MTKTRKQYSEQFKFKVALEAVKGLATINEIASRFVIAWQLSNTLDGLFCLEALRLALQQGKPKIFTTDQGAQFTAQVFTNELEAAGVLVSMDGRGRAYDNIFV